MSMQISPIPELSSTSSSSNSVLEEVPDRNTNKDFDGISHRFFANSLPKLSARVQELLPSDVKTETVGGFIGIGENRKPNNLVKIYYNPQTVSEAAMNATYNRAAGEVFSKA